MIKKFYGELIRKYREDHNINTVYTALYEHGRTMKYFGNHKEGVTWTNRLSRQIVKNAALMDKYDIKDKQEK